MKIFWLGQAGLLFDNGRSQVLIDPYFSDSVVKVNPKNYRRVPVKKELLELRPDVMIFTHDHLDHYDPETAPHFLDRTEPRMTVLSPTSVFRRALAHGTHNYVEFNPHTEWTEHGMRFTAVKAVHSDPHAIGVLIEDLEDGKTYYVTGDTLYSRDVLADVPLRVDVLFIPVNGVGNNMNMADAARFSREIGAAVTVPIHFGMFDSIDPAGLEVAHRVIPTLYEEISL